MIVGTGVDLVDVERLSQALGRRPQLLQRIFGEQERESLGDGPQRDMRLASRFAAKEALIKAAGGLRGSRWTDIQVIRRPGQAPALTVLGPLGQWLEDEGLRVWLSLSHERQAAVATVILECVRQGVNT